MKATKEELGKVLEVMKLQPLQIMQPEHDAQIIKLETERDLYRHLYNELLKTVMRSKGMRKMTATGAARDERRNEE